jgi:hypothetical protein
VSYASSFVSASGVDLYFRFDFLMEADVAGVSAAGERSDIERALHRRADHHLPPQFYSVWVATGIGVTGEEPAALRAPYRPQTEPDGGRDYNLNPSRWQVLDMRADVPWSAEWTRHCREAAIAAREFIGRREDVQERIRRATQALQAQHDSRVAQLNSRAMRLTGAARDAELNELECENLTHSTLLTAVRAPAFHMDVAGAVFVSTYTPFER